MKRYSQSASVGLVEPCDELVSAVHTMEQVFRAQYKVHLSQPNVALSLTGRPGGGCEIFTLNALSSFSLFNMLYLSEKLTKVYVVMRLFYAVKFSNRDLKLTSNTNSQTVRQSSK